MISRLKPLLGSVVSGGVKGFAATSLMLVCSSMANAQPLQTDLAMHSSDQLVSTADRYTLTQQATRKARFAQLLQSGDVLQTVPDAVLERQTGRYAGQPMIAGATFELLSNWRLQDQSVLSAGARLQFDLGGKIPQVSISTVANVSASPGHASSNSSTNGSNIISANIPLQGVRGAAQAIQIAGDRNSVINNVVLELQPAMAMTVGSSVNPQAQATAGDLNAQASVNASGLQIRLTGGNAGAINQSIGAGSAALTGTGIHQAVQLNSAANIVSNEATLSLQLGSAGVSSPINAGFRAALDQILGLGPR